MTLCQEPHAMRNASETDGTIEPQQQQGGPIRQLHISGHLARGQVVHCAGMQIRVRHDRVVIRLAAGGEIELAYECPDRFFVAALGCSKYPLTWADDPTCPPRSEDRPLVRTGPGGQFVRDTYAKRDPQQFEREYRCSPVSESQADPAV